MYAVSVHQPRLPKDLPSARSPTRPIFPHIAVQDGVMKDRLPKTNSSNLMHTHAVCPQRQTAAMPTPRFLQLSLPDHGGRSRCSGVGSLPLARRCALESRNVERPLVEPSHGTDTAACEPCLRKVAPKLSEAAHRAPPAQPSSASFPHFAYVQLPGLLA